MAAEKGGGHACSSSTDARVRYPVSVINIAIGVISSTSIAALSSGMIMVARARGMIENEQ
jgi:hypothetical protein